MRANEAHSHWSNRPTVRCTLPRGREGEHPVFGWGTERSRELSCVRFWQHSNMLCAWNEKYKKIYFDDSLPTLFCAKLREETRKNRLRTFIFSPPTYVYTWHTWQSKIKPLVKNNAFLYWVLEVNKEILQLKIWKRRGLKNRATW